MIVRTAFFALLAATATFTLPLASGAQTNPSPTPQSVQIEGVTVTIDDVHQFLGAMHQALQPNNMTVPVQVLAKHAAEMPAYDRETHYAGIQQQAGKKVMVIWVNGDRVKEIGQDAMIGAFVLAISDGGYGGAAFKQLYDIYAAKDAQLPAGAPDPYLNRHEFANAMVRSVLAGVATPSPRPSP
jgi:hypothetical protein